MDSEHFRSTPENARVLKFPRETSGRGKARAFMLVIAQAFGLCRANVCLALMIITRLPLKVNGGCSSCRPRERVMLSMLLLRAADLMHDAKCSQTACPRHIWDSTAAFLPNLGGG